MKRANKWLIAICALPFVATSFLASSLSVAAPPTATKVGPATVATFSGVHNDIGQSEPGSGGETLQTYTYPQIRHVSLTLAVSFASGSTAQMIQILATHPSDADPWQPMVIAEISSALGTEPVPYQVKTVEFDAKSWSIQVYNVWDPAHPNQTIPYIKYAGTEIYTP